MVVYLIGKKEDNTIKYFSASNKKFNSGKWFTKARIFKSGFNNKMVAMQYLHRFIKCGLFDGLTIDNFALVEVETDNIN